MPATTKLCSFSLLLVFIALIAVPLLAAGPGSLVCEMTLESKNFGKMGGAKLWIKGDNYRYEKLATWYTITLVKNADGVFLIHPEQRWAGKYAKGSDRERIENLVMGPVGDLAAYLKKVTARKVGNEAVDEVKCAIYKWDAPKTTYKMWVNEKKNVPAKLMRIGLGDKADTITVAYQKYESGAAVDDSQFVLPKDIPIRDMPNRVRKKDTAERKTDKPDEKAVQTPGGSSEKTEQPAEAKT